MSRGGDGVELEERTPRNSEASGNAYEGKNKRGKLERQRRGHEGMGKDRNREEKWRMGRIRGGNKEKRGKGG